MAEPTTIRVNSIQLTAEAVDLLFGADGPVREQFDSSKARKQGIMATAAIHTALGLQRPMTEAEVREANAELDGLVAKGILTAAEADARRPGAASADDEDGTEEAAGAGSDDAAISIPAGDPELESPETADGADGPAR